jgi:hypothetical protein
MTRYFISTISIPIIVLLLALCTTDQDITIGSKAFAQLLVSNVKSNTSRIISTVNNNNNNNVTMTIHTTNSIEGNNLNAIKQEEPVIKKKLF